MLRAITTPGNGYLVASWLLKKSGLQPLKMPTAVTLLYQIRIYDYANKPGNDA
jgi:hypothetical protein